MRTFFKEYLTPVAMVAMVGLFAYREFVPRDARPSAAVDGAKLGREYAPALASALADAWLDAASAIESGKTVADAQAALQDRFKAARVSAFTSKVAPDFGRVLPEGAEPRDSVHRAEVATLWRDFARGLKGGK